MDGLLAADTVEFLLLQGPQQLHLHVLIHLADFIEEDRALVRKLELAELALHSAGKGTLLVTKKLRFQQCGGNRSAVHADEGSVPPLARIVNAFGYKFLAGAALPADEHCRAAGGRLGGQGQNIDDLAAAANVVGKGFTGLFRAQQFLLKVFRLG